MGAVEDLVRPLLHPTESVNVAVETAQLPQVGLDAGTVDSGEDAGDPRRSASLGNAEEKEEIHCVLAVVFHVGAPGEVEEGSLFICKRKSTEDASNEVLDIHRAIPISKDFSITMAQTRRNTIDLSTAASRSVLDQPRVGFTIIVNSGQEGDEEPLYFYTHDTQSLKALLAECKRFKDQLLQEVDTTPGTYDTFIPTFAWLLPYVARARSSPSVTVRPWDIRILNQPLYSRLSHASAGQAGDEFSDIITIRDQWVRDTIRTTQQRGTRNLRIRLGTFNVNGTIPSQDLSSWVQGESAKPPASAQAEVQSPLLPVTPKGATHDADTKSIASGVTLVDPTEETATNADSTSDTSLDDDGDPDIFVFGFQELDLSTEALLITTSTFREDAWTTAIFAALGEKAIKYEKLASKQLVGMLITIIVRKSMKSNFKEVKSTSAGAGILGLMGNKGGAAIRLEYSPPPTQGLDLKSPLRTIFTFVNAHLAAFDEMYERRNADYQDLCKRLTFPTGVIAQPTTVATGLDRYTIFDTDVLFWIVNLNYRVDLLDKDIRETLQSGYPDKYEALLKYDQLRRAQRTGKAFVGFSEQTTSHLPTYRFGPGLPTDALGYDLKRKPAWTDRVLYMHDPAVKLSQVSYTGHRRITQSDHRPVGADFIVGVNLYENDQVDAAARKLYRQLEPLEHASLKPSLKVNTTSVDFGVFS
ncbi:hypothetical protein AX16_003289 [Volvariella volvacea WC 439]|nr:hypothetical protein AX16_003289 [Volvariella volvacea WC 439]